MEKEERRKRIHDMTMAAMEKNHSAFKKLAALERKEIALEQWNNPSQCCITCKGFSNEYCYVHIFNVSYDEAKKHTCEKHVYDTLEMHPELDI